MMRRAWIIGAGSAALAAAMGVARSDGHADAEEVELSPEEVGKVLLHAPIGAPPADPTNAYADDPRAADLGRMLFFDTRLSSNGLVSCATCHDPEQGLGDGRAITVGVEVGHRHAQSLWNVAHNKWFLWDGRRDSLWAQAIESIERAGEMDGHRAEVAELISEDAELRAAYEAVFGALGERVDAMSAVDIDARRREVWPGMEAEARRDVTRVLVNVGKSIAAYERTLASTDSPFDRFAAGLAAGEGGARTEISPAAQRGLKLFIGKANCAACHAGPNFTDGAFHDTLPPALPGGTRPDAGRAEGIADLLASEFRADSAWSDAPASAAAGRLKYLAQTPESWGAFKTPSLRSVALSPPYMHDGRFATLAEVVDHYADLPADGGGHHARDPLLRRLDLSAAERADLVAFLGSLTGEPPPAELLRPPARATPEAERP